MSDADTIRAVTIRLRGLPPDPDMMNGIRTGSAQTAIEAFMYVTNTDLEDVVADLITNLRHWCDRNGQDFEAELERGQGNYISETRAEAP